MAEPMNEQESKPRRGKVPGATPKHGRRKLTDSGIKNLELPASGQYEVRDAEQTGLSVRVSFMGTKSFYLAYTLSGKRRRLHLGTYSESRPADDLGKSGLYKIDDARRIARRKWELIKDGIDPAAVVRELVGAPTWAALCERYISEQARPRCKRERSVREYERQIRKFLLPAWGSLKAKAVDRAMVRELIGGIRAAGHDVQANRVQVLIGAICRFGCREDVLEANPCIGIEQVKEKSRERVLSNDEIRLLWPALEDAPALKILLLSGQRKNEVLGMQWSEINIESAVWEIPSARTKNGAAHRVPLTDSALRILNALPRNSDCVFSSLRRSFDRARQVSGIAENFTIHDLRRTVASKLGELGFDRSALIAKILNHSEGSGATKIYDRFKYDAEKRTALERWDRELARIVRGERAKVIEMADARERA